MKPPVYAPAYAALYPVLCEIARSHGYALAIHGTLARDMDLVAVPWVENCSSAIELMDAISKHVAACMDVKNGKGIPLYVPERKPHGRVSWAIPLEFGAVIDLSVMPLVKEAS